MNGTRSYSKEMWSNTIWAEAWILEDIDWDPRSAQFNSSNIYKNIDNGPNYMVWWKIADRFPAIVRQCEVMVKLYVEQVRSRWMIKD